MVALRIACSASFFSLAPSFFVHDIVYGIKLVSAFFFAVATSFIRSSPSSSSSLLHALYNANNNARRRFDGGGISLYTDLLVNGSLVHCHHTWGK